MRTTCNAAASATSNVLRCDALLTDGVSNSRQPPTLQHCRLQHWVRALTTPITSLKEAAWIVALLAQASYFQLSLANAH